MHIWDPDGYHNNSVIQYNAACELLNKFTINGSELVLDVGCGDGKISAKIAEKVPW